MREYFSGQGTHQLNHSLFGMPPSPPATPTRVLSNTTQQDEMLPSYTASQGRRPSEAYAHHRRTSTTTIIRLAVASARSGTAVPTKIITGLFLLLSLGYLVTFLPFPSRFVHHPQPSAMVSTPNPFIPSYSQHPAQQQQQKKVEPDSSIDDVVAQRKAWSQTFDHRAPPHLAAPLPVVRANRAGKQQELFSVDGELMRAHPELLSHGRGAQQRRRMPVRLAGGKGAQVAAARSEPKKEDRHAMVEEDDAPSVEDTIDVSRATDSEQKAAAAVGARRGKPKAAAPRKKAMERMAKMAKAKAGSARVGGTAPLDSSAQGVDSHVFVKGGSERKKAFKGAKHLTAEDADVPKPKEIAAAVGKGHPRNAVKGVVAAAAVEQEAEGIHEDWRSSAVEAEGEGDE